MTCKYQKQCENYDPDSYTCANDAEDGYCGLYWKHEAEAARFAAESGWLKWLLLGIGVALFAVAAVLYAVPGALASDQPALVACPARECDCPNSCPAVQSNQLDDLTALWANATAGKTFKLHEYDCTDASSDTIAAWSAAGYEAVPQMGVLKTTNSPYGRGLHSWVKVCLPFEAVTGKFPDPTEYGDSYTFTRQALI